MSISFFVHFAGELGRAAGFGAAALETFKRLAGDLGPDASVVVHEPLPVAGADPLPVAQDARALMCQIRVKGAETARSERVAMVSGLLGGALGRLDRWPPGLSQVAHQVMTTETLKDGDPGDSPSPDPVSFFVQYDGPAKDPEAFRSYYREHHVPIVRRMPGIIRLHYHTPSRFVGPAVGRRVDHLQLVQATFRSADGFQAMRNSSERREGLRDFDNYPPFSGAVTHQVMQSAALLP
jgi:uncharacterized protein (TIGR02118 family)